MECNVKNGKCVLLVLLSGLGVVGACADGGVEGESLEQVAGLAGAQTETRQPPSEGRGFYEYNAMLTVR